MTEEIYDKAEYEKALKWTKEKCKEGYDKNPDFVKASDEPLQYVRTSAKI